MKMINTSECERCKHGTVDDTNKARVKVHCDIKIRIISMVHVFHVKIRRVNSGSIKSKKRRNS